MKSSLGIIQNCVLDLTGSDCTACHRKYDYPRGKKKSSRDSKNLRVFAGFRDKSKRTATSSRVFNLKFNCNSTNYPAEKVITSEAERSGEPHRKLEKHT